MSVFVRASLQGPPKTSLGHVALHHMPGLPMNLQSLPPQRKGPTPLEPKPAQLGLKPLVPLPQAQHFRWSHF